MGADSGLAAGLVVVEGDEDAGLVKVSGTAEGFGLPGGQGGAAGSQAGVAAWACQGETSMPQGV